MKVLINGCTGYVGCQIITILSAAGYHVIGTSRSPISIPGIEILIGNHLSPTFVSAAIERVDIIIHFAARTRGRPHSKDDVSIFEIIY